VSEYEAEFPELKVAPEESPEHRGIDPSLAVARAGGDLPLSKRLQQRLPAERTYRPASGRGPDGCQPPQRPRVLWELAQIVHK
jgi:hypothetical protein